MEPVAAEMVDRGAFVATAAGVALLSYAVLTLEIALTRVFSVMVDYHSAFAIISAAVLGLGIGGLVRKRGARSGILAAPSTTAVAFAVSTVVSLVIIVTLPGFGTASFLLRTAVAVMPFLAAGMALSSAFQQNPARSSLLYAADLVGAAFAALLAVPSLDGLGAPTTVLQAAAVAALAAVLLARAGAGRWLPPALVFAATASLVGVLSAWRVPLPVPVANDPGKEMHLLLSEPTYQARILESRWGAFGRTDLVESALMPSQRMLFVDGAAGAVMYHLDGAWKERREVSGVVVPYGVYLPLRMLPGDWKRSALIIGAGGGRDVVLALSAGVKKVTAVEVNPEIVKLVQEQGDWNGGIYSGDRDVTVVVAEGRSFVMGTTDRYDVIVLALPVTKSSRSVDGYALTESYLFTVEAFDDYMGHLTEHGSIVAIAHNEVEVYRLLAVAARSFERRGVGNADFMRRVYTLPSRPMPALVVQKDAIVTEASDAIRGVLHDLRLDREPFYVPCASLHDTRCEGSGQATETKLVDVAQGRATFAGLASLATYDISPVDDDRPFFFDLERGLPRPLGAFAILLAIGATGLGYLALASYWPARRQSRLARAGRARGQVARRLVLVFALLGAAYMLVEVALFQKLMLFVGQPQKALTVLLFSLLLGSGLGALASHAVRRTPATVAAGISLGVCMLVLLLALTFRVLFRWGLPVQATAMLALVPLGFLMGMPFPLAVRVADAHGLSERVAALWGANGVASALGAVAAILIAHVASFTWALASGAALYLASALLLGTVAAEPLSSARGPGAPAV